MSEVVATTAAIRADQYKIVNIAGAALVWDAETRFREALLVRTD